MEPRFNFWFEKDEKVALSIWRVRLLVAVAATGSISQAARVMDVPYRIAWQKIYEMEVHLGEKLVETQVGGKMGGEAHLTAAAGQYVEQFGRFSEKVQVFLQSRFEDIFMS